MHSGQRFCGTVGYIEYDPRVPLTLRRRIELL